MAERRKGYLRCYRKSMDADDPLWSATPFDPWRARWDIIQRAAFVRYTDDDGVDLDRGQVRVSIGFLAQRWGWTIKKVRGFVTKLVAMETIKLDRRTREGSVYDVVNYEQFQPSEGHSQVTGQQRLTDDQGIVTEEGHSKGHSKGHSETTDSKGTSAEQGHSKGHSKGHHIEGSNVEGRREKRGREVGIGREGTDRKTVARAQGAAPVLGEGLPDIPPDLDTPDLRRALMERIAERSKAGKRFHVTPESLTVLYRQLSKVADARGMDHAIFCLEKATTSRNQGVVFKEDLKPDGSGRQGSLFAPKPDAPPPSTDRQRRQRF